MGRRELGRYHDLAASTKARGEGIGFAGVGIKLGLLVAEAVLTETRRGAVHVASRWHLASRQKAPWQWVAPPGWVGERGTAVGLKLRNPLSPLLDAGYVEGRLRLHFEPLFDPAFDAILAERYPSGVAFSVNGRAVARRGATGAGERAKLVVRLPRKRKPAAFGFLERVDRPLPEDLQGLAVSTLGKVIRRGWDWIGLSSASPGLVGGLIEAPGLSAALTLNKGDFVRAGRRGITYLAYRKALQEAVLAQLAAWGEARDREDSARRRAARPLERDLESVLLDLADDFPALAALVERRPGGQKRLPTGREAVPGSTGSTAADGDPSPVPLESEPLEGAVAERAGAEPPGVRNGGGGRRGGFGAGAAGAGRGRSAGGDVRGDDPRAAGGHGRPAAPDPVRPRDRLRGAARVARPGPARRVHRPRERGAPGLPPRRGLTLRGLPRRPHRGDGPRGGGGGAGGHAGVPDRVPRPLGRGGRPRPEAPPAPRCRPRSGSRGERLSAEDCDPDARRSPDGAHHPASLDARVGRHERHPLTMAVAAIRRSKGSPGKVAGRNAATAATSTSRSRMATPLRSRTPAATPGACQWVGCRPRPASARAPSA